MPSYTFEITDTFTKLLDFKSLKILYSNIEIENFDGPFLEFAFGDPSKGAKTEIRVPNECSITRDNRPLAGEFWGKTSSGTAIIQVMIW